MPNKHTTDPQHTSCRSYNQPRECRTQTLPCRALRCSLGPRLALITTVEKPMMSKTLAFKFSEVRRTLHQLLLLSCAKSHMLSASRRQPRLLHVSAVDRRQTWRFAPMKQCYATQTETSATR